MTSPTPDELAEWNRIEDAATKEPWFVKTVWWPGQSPSHSLCGGDTDTFAPTDADWALIVTARNNFRRLIDEVERLTEERDYYKDGYWLQDKQLGDVEQACIEAGIQTTDSMGMTDVWAEFVREIVRQRDESRAEVERLRADYADAIKRNGDLAVRAGHAEGMLVGIGYHGDVVKMLDNFRAENERLRSDLARTVAEYEAGRR